MAVNRTRRGDKYSFGFFVIGGKRMLEEWEYWKWVSDKLLPEKQAKYWQRKSIDKLKKRLDFQDF